ncbi:MAG: hypothetical protein U0441_19015 [Polyangiaceae bacterium]
MHALAPSLRRSATTSFALAILLCGAAASAQTAPDSASTTRPLLVLAAPQVEGTDVDDRAVAVVTAHLRALSIDVRVVRTEATNGDLSGVRDGARKLIGSVSARGALWIDAGSEENLGLYALERDGDELYGRRVVAAPGKTATALESLAGIAAAVGEELSQGHATGLPKIDVTAKPNRGDARADASADNAPPAAPSEKEDAAPEAPADEAKPEPEKKPVRPLVDRDSGDTVTRVTSWPRLAFSASYVGGTFGGAQPWQNGASLRASFAPVPGLYLGAGYDVMAPSKAASTRGTFELTRHPVFAGGGYRISASSRIDLQFGARATFDVAQHDFTADRQNAPSNGGAAPPPPPPGGGPGGGGPIDDRTHSMTGLLMSAAPVAEGFFLISDQLRMNLMIGVDFPFAYSSVSGAPAGASAPPVGVAWDPIRFIAGIGFEYGLALPSSHKPTQTGHH